ncbi:hypothetical protein HMN09_00990800 [Mycena chlorophos]|uniref:ABM domain-containing protein n=1 Tax=Mycena chlorophos TaxID=658473 RepID=A0A8H6SI78_MYCCL|nr:hypothetical protein HMN09_00990800 [Mycena chlorophos]
MPAPASIPTPHYAVIFTSKRVSHPNDGYPEMAARMDQLAAEQPGYLGVDHAAQPLPSELNDVSSTISSITVSYWRDEESIQAWKRNVDHLLAQRKGRTGWYLSYEVRVAKVERAYTFSAT